MSTFTLTVFPDGRLILTTPEYLDSENAKRILEMFEKWRDSPVARAQLVIPDCEVQHATSIEVDLEGVEG